MRRHIMIAMVALLTTGTTRAAAQSQPREQLEARVVGRFVELAAERIGVPQAERPRFGTVLRQYAQARQQLARRGGMLQRRLLEATAHASTSDAEFQRLFADLRAVRDEESRLFDAEQAALAEFLTPRQRAELLVARGRMIQRANEIRGRRAPGGGMGPPHGAAPGGGGPTHL